MMFSLHFPCHGSGASCGYYILAQGTIARDTPEKLETFLKAQQFRPTMFFNSPGGNLAAGIKVGYIIRRLMYDTYVGGPYLQANELYQPSKVIVAKAICFSACAYAFLGGVSRELNSGGALGVHQFSGGAKDIGQSAAQVTTALLGQYLDDMGVDRRLLDLASLTGPNEVQIISLQLARELNVDNTDPPKQPWQLKPDEQGNLSLLAIQRQPRRNGVVSMTFRRKGDGLIGIVAYRIRQNFRTPEEMLEIFHDPPEFRLNVRDREYTTATLSIWRRLDSDTFEAEFAITSKALLEVSQAATFELWVRWTNVARDVNPSTMFGTEGLRNGIRALIR